MGGTSPTPLATTSLVRRMMQLTESAQRCLLKVPPLGRCHLGVWAIALGRWTVTEMIPCFGENAPVR